MHFKNCINKVWQQHSLTALFIILCLTSPDGGGVVLVRGQIPSNPYAHRVVLANSAQEAALPSRLLNPFYQDLKIRRALAKSSWFGPNELPVYERGTDSITRRQIFTVLNHAGLLPQQQHHHQQTAPLFKF